MSPESKSTLGAKLMLDELDDGTSGNAARFSKESPRPDGTGEDGGGGRSAEGGMLLRGGSCTLEDDALRTTTNGRVELGDTGESVLVTVDERDRLKITGEGDGALDEGVGELKGSEAFRLSCGGIGISLGTNSPPALRKPRLLLTSAVAIVIPLALAGCPRERGRKKWLLLGGGSLRRFWGSLVTVDEEEEFEPGVCRRECSCSGTSIGTSLPRREFCRNRSDPLLRDGPSRGDVSREDWPSEECPWEFDDEDPYDMRLWNMVSLVLQLGSSMEVSE